MMLPLSLPFSGLNKPNDFSHSSHVLSSRPFIISVALFGTPRAGETVSFTRGIPFTACFPFFWGTYLLGCASVLCAVLGSSHQERARGPGLCLENGNRSVRRWEHNLMVSS